MLKVDLAWLERTRRVSIEAEVAPEELGVEREDVRFLAPVAVRLEAQQAGPDVVVRGSIGAEVELSCRRCLSAVRRRFEEAVTLLYREDADEADAEDVYALSPRASELDLLPAAREHVLLTVPSFVVCDESCRGLCPICGVNRNEQACSCAPTERDERWAALRRLQSE